MKQIIKDFLAAILKDIGVPDAGIAVEVPENPAHGDYTTNVAMLLASRLKAQPAKIAQQITEAIIKYQKESGAGKLEWLAKAEVAPPGFVNLWLSEAYFGTELAEVLEKKEAYGSSKKEEFPAENQAQKVGASQISNSVSFRLSPLPPLSPEKAPENRKSAGKPAKKGSVASFGKTIMVEFAHPNTHKAFHIGHLRNITTGEAIVRLLESQGNAVTRVNYQGDVGMHIAKALYALLELSPYKNEVASVKGIKTRVEFLGKAYAAGSAAFEESDHAKEAIGEINKQIYARDPAIYPLYQETRQWSLDYFASIYERVGTHFDRLYFESECFSGVKTAKDAVKRGVLKESDGAIIFDGKPHGLDTRVFVNSLGLPTYEAKELALAPMEVSEFGALDRLIHVVGPEQASFFAVTFKVEELLGIVRPGVQHHLVYGWVKLKQGKMSSRLGNVVLGEWLLNEAKKEVYTILKRSKSDYKKEEQEIIAETCAVAAVKYAFLRVGTKQEIAFDLKESVSFDGDSGPYLLYSYARGKSVLRRASLSDLGTLSDVAFNPEERSLARRIAQFPDVVAEAARNFTPNTLATYLFHLAQEFNLFYAKHGILGNAQRLALTAVTAQVLKNGLYLLGIPVVERM